MTTQFKEGNPEKGLLWEPKKGTINNIVNPTDEILGEGVYLVGGYTKSPEKLVSFKNPQLMGKENTEFKNEPTEPETVPLQVTLVLKDADIIETDTLTVDDIFVSATDDKGESLTAELALTGIVLPNTVGEHTVTHTLKGADIKGEVNEATATCKVNIKAEILPEKVTLVLKDAEGEVVTLNDVFVSATDDKGESLTAELALKGLTLPTDVGTHEVTHTLKGADIKGEVNEVTAKCSVTIKEKEVETPPEKEDEGVEVKKATTKKSTKKVETAE